MVAGVAGSKLQDVLKHVVEERYTELEAVIIQLRPMTENGVRGIHRISNNVIYNLVQVNKWRTRLDTLRNFLAFQGSLFFELIHVHCSWCSLTYCGPATSLST